MTSTPVRVVLAPACRIGEHGECPGPHALRRPGAPAWEHPAETYRCTCPCHTVRSTPVG